MWRLRANPMEAPVRPKLAVDAGLVSGRRVGRRRIWDSDDFWTGLITRSDDGYIDASRLAEETCR